MEHFRSSLIFNGITIGKKNKLILTDAFWYAGSYVVVDESGREEALESGSKVACIVSQVLFHEQVRLFQKSPEWFVVVPSTNF